MELFPTGLFAFSFWQYCLIVLLLTHITIAAVTIYLHRHQAHRALDLHPVVAHFFRFWLWLTTGMSTKEWVAIHRKHHAKCEMEEDPHSPVVWLSNVTSRWKRATLMCYWVAWKGVRSYVCESHVKETLDKHGAGTPNDWIERNCYARFPKTGILLLGLINTTVFGILVGPVIWLVQLIWIPVFAAGIINGIGHLWGYRNFASCHRKSGLPDSSRNIIPWGILIGGEELHNNHHGFEKSAKLSSRWFEFDIGYLYIQILVLFRLAKIKYIHDAKVAS